MAATGSGKPEARQNNKTRPVSLQAADFNTHNPGVCVWQPRLPVGETFSGCANGCSRVELRMVYLIF